MIFVTLGTQDKQFKRLIIAVEREIIRGNIKEKVILQSGSTKYKTSLSKDQLEIIPYISGKQFEEYMNESSFIITHAGVGTIIEGLKKGKKIIAVARLKRFGEHVNDHQKQIVENFSEEGYLLALDNVDDLYKVLPKIKNFKVRTFESNNKNFLRNLEKDLENLLY